MSVIHQKHSPTDSTEIAITTSDVAGKFRIYRMDAESTGRKLKDANAVIERLKAEINFSRDSEKNLRNQLSSAQNRLIYLQRVLKKVITISEQQRQNEKISKQIEQKIEKINEAIECAREKCQNLFKHVSREADLLKETENLKSILAMKTSENDLMKAQIQTLTTEKKDMETAIQQKLSDLENELEKLKQTKADAEASYGETLTCYQQQLEEKNQIITLYEKERKGFLDDFEPLKVSEIDSGNIKYAYGIISTNSPKRAPKVVSFEGHKSQTKPEESNIMSLGREDQSFPKESRKQKRQLEFLKPQQCSSQGTNSVTSGRKRRLFSTNCNYYID